jgi:hypothetical protein
MIKFFRRIRLDLMEKNKTGRYLKYAIGEIALVVIGILVALQINNWNESRKDNLRERAILIQIEEEYRANLAQLEAKMQMRSIVVNCGLRVLTYMNTPKIIPRDSVLLLLSRINNDATFDPIQNDLISSGNIRLIKNNQLKSLLSSWSSDLIAVQEQEEMTQMLVHQIIRPLYDDLGITRDMMNFAYKIENDNYWMLDSSSDSDSDSENVIEFGSSLNSTSSYEILSNTKLEGVVSNAVNINYLGNMESRTLKNRILQILELIHTELNK